MTFIPTNRRVNPQDLDLPNMSDEDIVTAASKFSYDIEQCKTRLRAGGDWNRVIQAHLFYDHVLTKMIEEDLTDPSHLNLDRTAFANKLDLSAALGLIKGTDKAFLKRLNRLRNDIAHDLGFVINRRHATELHALLQDEMKELVAEYRASNGGTILSVTLLVFAVFLDITRQRLAATRLLEEKRRIKLAAAIENARKVLEETAPN